MIMRNINKLFPIPLLLSIFNFLFFGRTFMSEQHELNTKMESPEFYMQDGVVITQAVERLEQIQKELSQAYERWGELEE